MIGVIIYDVVDVVLQFLPPHYSPISQAESDLAVGPFGLVMSVNFFGRGITSGALLAAILATAPRTRARATGVALLAIAGLCSALIAFFPTDIPTHGGVAPSTVSGIVHVVGATSGFVLALAALWVFRFWRPAKRKSADVFLGIASAGIVFLGFSILARPEVLGLAERICLIGILGWVFVIALHLRTLTD
jgi:hypothetical membrane protein